MELPTRLSKSQNLSLREEINNFLTRWHNDFLLDYWWRRKHNVAFGSSAHREMNFLDMLIEYQEELMIRRSRIKAERKEEEEWLGKREDVISLSKKEIDEDYENLNLEEYNG